MSLHDDDDYFFWVQIIRCGKVKQLSHCYKTVMGQINIMNDYLRNLSFSPKIYEMIYFPFFWYLEMNFDIALPPVLPNWHIYSFLIKAIISVIHRNETIPLWQDDFKHQNHLLNTFIYYKMTLHLYQCHTVLWSSLHKIMIGIGRRKLWRWFLFRGQICNSLLQIYSAHFP